MEQNKSAITQMMMGERGNLNNIKMSEEYCQALDLLVQKLQDFLSKLEKYPKLLALYKEVEKAFENENAIGTVDVYREAFAFGLAMGLEIK